MMEINRSNYEAYFLDYLEGNLAESLVDEFIEFLQKNQDLKEELALFESVSLEPEDISFSNKKNLYKEEFDATDRFNEAAVAKLEGDLSEEDQQRFEAYLNAHPEQRKEAELFEKTILKPEEEIVFAKKDKLYKSAGTRVFYLWAGRVAAVLILGLAVYNFIDFGPETEVPKNQVAVVDDKILKDDKVEKKELKPEIPTVETKQEIQKPQKPEKKKPVAKPEIKKVAPKKKATKSIRENSRGRLESETITAKRVPLEVPESMQALAANISVKHPKAQLATMYISYPEEYYEGQLLASQIRETINFSKFTQAGLNLVSTLSNRKFSYETDKDGKVTEYNYNSRLLAFTIPTRKTHQ